MSIQQQGNDIDLRIVIFTVAPFQLWRPGGNDGKGGYHTADCLVQPEFYRDEHGVAEVWSLEDREKVYLLAVELCGKINAPLLSAKFRDRCKTFESMIEKVGADCISDSLFS